MLSTLDALRSLTRKSNLKCTLKGLPLQLLGGDCLDENLDSRCFAHRSRAPTRDRMEAGSFPHTWTWTLGRTGWGVDLE